MISIKLRKRTLERILLPALIVLIICSSYTPNWARSEMISMRKNMVSQDTIREKNLKQANVELVSEENKTSPQDKTTVIKPVDNALEKADQMMIEINNELIKDKILTENRKKVTLMFQYSNILNGKEALGDKYEKYKSIFNRYFPVYDSYATTRVFRYDFDKTLKTE